ncbi:uncharacterized protein LOC144106799 [Amblyomma americanum]
MEHQKDSVFVREACVEIFSVAGLVGRSVTGGMSNRTKAKPKPALDAAKFAALDAFFKHYLQSRCSPGEVAMRHRGLRKIVAMKIADVMKVHLLHRYLKLDSPEVHAHNLDQCINKP